jgi:hypothetical protein
MSQRPPRAATQRIAALRRSVSRARAAPALCKGNRAEILTSAVQAIVAAIRISTTMTTRLSVGLRSSDLRVGTGGHWFLALALTLATFGGAGCRSEQAPSDAPVAGASKNAGPQWKPKTRYTYRLGMVTRTAIPPADAPIEFHLKGNLELVPRIRPDGEIQFQARLGGGELRSGSKGQNAALTKVVEELSDPYVFALHNGRLTELFFPKTSSPLAVGIRRTLAAALQFAPGKGATWTSTEHDASGEYVAEYRAGASAGAYAKRKLRYTKLIASSPTPAVSVQKNLVPKVARSSGGIEIDNGLLRLLKQRDELSMPLGETAKLLSTTELELTHTQLQALPSPPDFQTVLSGAVRIASDQPSAQAGLQQSLEEARIAGKSFEQAVLELEQLEKNRRQNDRRAQPGGGDDTEEQESQIRQSSAAFTALAALLRTKPEAIPKAVAKVRAGSPAQHVLLDALSSSGTDAAQAALVGLVTDRRIDRALRARAATSLIRTARASASTVEALIRLVDDRDLSTVGIYGLGTAARRLREAGEHELSERAAGAVLQQLRSAKKEVDKIHALRGIANSGHDGAFDAVRPLLKDPSPQVRGAAVEAIRLMRHESVDTLIIEQLEQDTESSVRLAALNAMKMREPSDELASALTRLVRTTDDPYARLKAVELMGRWLPQRPDLKKVLEQIARDDARPKIRAAAEAALGA